MNFLLFNNNCGILISFSLLCFINEIQIMFCCVSYTVVRIATFFLRVKIYLFFSLQTSEWAWTRLSDAFTTRLCRPPSVTSMSVTPFISRLSPSKESKRRPLLSERINQLSPKKFLFYHFFCISAIHNCFNDLNLFWIIFALLLLYMIIWIKQFKQYQRNVGSNHSQEIYKLEKLFIICLISEFKVP